MSASDKTASGFFFEDYTLGQVFDHATPRTVTEGDRAAYLSLYPSRFALPSADSFAQSCGLSRSPLEELIGFHVVFGKTVPDISLNALANLGYAEGRWLKPVWPGDTIRSTSEVIGVKQNSNGKSGVVWVRTRGMNQHDEVVLDYVRWAMVRKRDFESAAPEAVIPTLKPALEAGDLVVPEGRDFTSYDFTLAGEPQRWGDYEVGETIDHVDGVTVEAAEHMMATRLWQNTAKVHFNVQAREDGRRLIYGGHVISLARALSFNGLANAQWIAAINGGVHAAPCFAGDTVYAWSEVIETAETPAPGVGAIRLRVIASTSPEPGPPKGEDGKPAPGILLDLDLWALGPA